MTNPKAVNPPRTGRVAAWFATHRGTIVGALLVMLAIGFAIWVTIASAPLSSQRTTVITWLGGGAYLVATVVADIGLFLSLRHVRGVVRSHPQRGRFVAALTVTGFALWGISGAVAPDATLGGVSLATVSAGGQVGDAFNSLWGWPVIVALLLIASGLAWPSAMRRAAKWLGAELRLRGPRALQAIARVVYRALVGLLGLIWRMIGAAARELWWSIRVIWEDRGQVRGKSDQVSDDADVRDGYDSSLRQRTPPAPPPPPPIIDEPAWPPLIESAEGETPTTVEQTSVRDTTEEPDPVLAETSSLRTLDRLATDGWRLPAIDVLDQDPSADTHSGADQQARVIVETLASFGVDAAVTQINEGPTITQFGIEPGWEIKTRQTPERDKAGAAVVDDQGRPVMRTEEVSRTRVRVNRITRLADDLALALAAPSIRVEAPVPGQPVVGIEVPNANTRIVSLRSLIESETFASVAATGGLPIALGRDVTGSPVIADLTRMPHVLIAGATGSGKSVCINTIISSLLMQKSPAEVRVVLVDPKRVELTNYGEIPHLAFSHVVTEPDEVVSVLGVVVGEMDRRYRRLEQFKARNIVAYNALPHVEKALPYWVVVLDELADMMLAAPAEVETQLVRLAQLARAVGIHLVVATQRPSVDVVTGLIKANFPTRIAFATTSQIDARVIMDRVGAEKLMGRGDMLYMSSDTIKPRRVQGAYVSDAEIERLLAAWTQPLAAADERTSLDAMLERLSADSPAAAEEVQARAVQMELDSLNGTLESVLSSDGEVEEPDIVREAQPDAVAELDTRIDEATALATEYERISASLLQRRMRVGRPRAERLIEQLEQQGVISASEGGERSRKVLARPT